MSFIQKIRRFQRAVTYVRLRTTHVLLCPLAKLCCKKKQIWIVSERGTDARDNGYHLFRYMRENHPEQPVYYVIDRRSPDYSKVSTLGNAVHRGSLKYWILYLGAAIKISTHINGYAPDNNWNYLRFAEKQRGITVFLQHGITKDDIKGFHKQNTGLALFICGAKPEYDYLLAHFGYSQQELKYTGFARFDSLHGCTPRRQVLIMPTWRRWLSNDADPNNTQSIKNSTYLKSWSSLLKSERLRELAQQYDVSFVFYPHYEVQPYLHLFGKSDEYVTIADFAHFDVQQLLKESMLLITDYSSVFFDFAYMEKPVLYYQFDESEYRAHHYEQGYFDYRRDGFGEVVTDERELLALLERYLEDDCRLKPEYQQRIHGFFPLHDKKNCERIYQEIKNLS